MRVRIKTSIMVVSLILGALAASAAQAVEIGAQAPDFIAQSSQRKEVRLSDYKGKVVVLEWLNHGCPFVKKHYDGKNMQVLQADLAKKGVIWLSIVSSAKGKQGYGTPEQAEKARKEHGSAATAVLLDSSGEVGRLYGAKTTPHMFVIDAHGRLAYQGAIDDKPSTEAASLKGARNHVREALDAVLAGRMPATAQTGSYGCSVKYE